MTIWSSQPFSTLYSPSQASSDPLRDDVSLQLGYSTDNREDRTTKGGAGVNVLLIADEINPQMAEFLKGQNQVLGAPSEPVEPPDQHHIEPSLSSW